MMAIIYEGNLTPLPKINLCYALLCIANFSSYYVPMLLSIIHHYFCQCQILISININVMDMKRHILIWFFFNIHVGG